MKSSKITVKPNGTVKLETFGFVGKECADVDKVLKGLSNDINFKKKAEYFANDQDTDVTIVGSN